MSEIWLLRHGETEWSVLRRHTGRTDIPLSPRGEKQGASLGPRMRLRHFALVLSSPLLRARRTCDLAGYGATALVDPNLAEWDYGIYEGRTTAEIRAEDPNWNIWDTEVPRGESVEQVGARADLVIARARAATGDVAIFAHAHLLRVLAARWVGLAASGGKSFVLETASLSILGYERETPVIQVWNDTTHLRSP